MADRVTVLFLMDVAVHGQEKLDAMAAKVETAGSKAALLATGVEAGAGGAAGSLEKQGARMEKSSGGIARALEKTGGLAGAWGLPFEGAFTRAAKSMDTAGKSGGGFLGIMSKISTPQLAAAAAAAAVAGESIHLGTNYQKTVSMIAASADISVGAAQKVGSAFLSTAGESTFSAQQIATAYASVAGQLGEVQGSALTATQALAVMRTATTLAEASGTDLGAATKSTAQIMQTFQIPVSGIARVTDQLFSTARVTGTSIDNLTSTMSRLKARMGVTAPTVGEMGSMLVDLADHGVTGSRGLMVVNTAMNTLIANSNKIGPAQAKAVASAEKTATATAAKLQKAQARLAELQASSAGAAAAKLQKAQAHLAELQAVDAGKTNLSIQQQYALADARKAVADATAAAGGTQLSVQQQYALSNAQQAVTDAAGANAAAQAALQSAQQKSGNTALQMGVHVFDAKGKFVGFRDIIAQLQPKLAGLTQQQQLAALQTLFGNNANKALLTTVLAGPAAYDKASAAVNKTGAAHAAAEKATANFKSSVEKLRAVGVDLGIKLGTALIPTITTLGRVVAEVIGWFLKHKAVAIALALVIGDVLTGGVSTLIAIAIVLSKNWNTIWSDMKRWTLDGVRAIVDAFLDMAGTIVHGAADAFGWVPGLGGKLKDAARHFDDFKLSVDASLGDVGARAVLATEKIADMNRAAVAAGQPARNAIQIATGAGAGVSTTAIKRLQEGAWVTKPTLAIVGEAGPELVIPASKLPGGTASLGNAPGALPRTRAASAPGSGVPSAAYTIYEIAQMVVVANDPAQFEQQMAQRARAAALSGNTFGGANLATAS